MTADRLAVVLLSGASIDGRGGLAREAGYRLLALTVDYNQRHRIELQVAANVARRLGAERYILLLLDLSRFGGSALTDDIEVPKGGLGNDIPVTYVPARNTIFLALCLGWAGGGRARPVHRRQRARLFGYPDCRLEFVAAFERMRTSAPRPASRGRASPSTRR